MGESTDKVAAGAGRVTRDHGDVDRSSKCQPGGCWWPGTQHFTPVP